MICGFAGLPTEGTTSTDTGVVKGFIRKLTLYTALPVAIKRRYNPAFAPASDVRNDGLLYPIPRRYSHISMGRPRDFDAFYSYLHWMLQSCLQYGCQWDTKKAL